MVFLQAPLLRNTQQGGREIIHQKHLEGLIVNTIGTVGPKVYGGVLTETARGMPSKAHIPVIRSKTQATKEGQVPYAGPKY